MGTYRRPKPKAWWVLTPHLSLFFIPEEVNQKNTTLFIFLIFEITVQLAVEYVDICASKYPSSDTLLMGEWHSFCEGKWMGCRIVVNWSLLKI
jgi:hypothetical protein